LQCVAVCCSVLQCVAVCCSTKSHSATGWQWLASSKHDLALFWNNKFSLAKRSDDLLSLWIMATLYKLHTSRNTIEKFWKYIQSQSERAWERERKRGRERERERAKGKERARAREREQARESSQKKGKLTIVYSWESTVPNCLPLKTALFCLIGLRSYEIMHVITWIYKYVYVYVCFYVYASVFYRSFHYCNCVNLPQQPAMILNVHVYSSM